MQCPISPPLLPSARRIRSTVDSQDERAKTLFEEKKVLENRLTYYRDREERYVETFSVNNQLQEDLKKCRIDLEQTQNDLDQERVRKETLDILEERNQKLQSEKREQKVVIDQLREEVQKLSAGSKQISADILGECKEQQMQILGEALKFFQEHLLEYFHQQNETTCRNKISQAFSNESFLEELTDKLSQLLQNE